MYCTGSISKEGLLKIVTHLFQLMVDIDTMKAEECGPPERLVDTLFAEVDVDNDGYLTVDDYKAAAVKNPRILQALAMF